MTQSTNVRCSISDRVADVTPTTRTVLEEDVSGVRTGGSTVAGSRPAASTEPLGERLAGAIDVLVLGEDGGDDGEALDRLRADGGDALHAVDGVLDRLGDQHLDLLGREPGASVWIETCGGANSGNTSRRGVRDHAARRRRSARARAR